MVETTLSQSEVKSQGAPHRRERRPRSPWTGWVLTGIILCIALAALPAYRRARLSFQLQAARDALRQAEMAAAIKQLKPLVQARPDLAEPHYLLAVAYRRQGQLGKVAPLLEQAEKLGWSRRDIKRQQYLTLFLDGYIRETEPYLRTLMNDKTTDDEAAELYEAFVKGYLSELRFQQAEFCINFWLEWRPHEVQPRLWRAEMAAVQHDIDRQIAEYRKILEFHPQHYEAHARLAGALLMRNEVEEAHQHFRQCLRLHSEDPMPRVGLAECQQRLGKATEAKETVTAALDGSLSPTDQATAFKTLGKIELELGNVPEAVASLEKSIKLNPRDSDAMYSLGLALQRVGRKPEAEQHLARSRELRDREVQKSDLANEILDDLENPDLRSKAGMMLLEQGEDEEAFLWLTSALRIDSGHRPSHEALVTYYERRDDHEMAAKHRIAAATRIPSPSSQETP